MRKVLVVASLAAMAAVASPAAAETSLGSLCGPSGNGMVGCASVAVELSGSTLTVKVANLHGVNGDAYRLTSFGVYALQSAGYGTSALTPDPTVTGPVSWTNGVLNEFKMDNGSPYAWLASANSGSGNDGIIGCGADPSGDEQSVSSCAGPLSFNFTLASSTLTQADLGSLQFAFRGKAFGDGGSLKCFSDLDGKQSCGPTTVTPEPATLALLASGLFGLGGVGFLRRRRGQLDS